jgi:hypothetical protein
VLRNAERDYRSMIASKAIEHFANLQCAAACSAVPT